MPVRAEPEGGSGHAMCQCTGEIGALLRLAHHVSERVPRKLEACRDNCMHHVACSIVATGPLPVYFKFKLTVG